VEKRKALSERMRDGEFLISVQIDPPGKGKFSDFIKTMRILKKFGVRLLDINSSRRVSHDSIQLACELSRMGFETIPHVTTRDSSVNGLMNQILAAYDWGRVKSFLIITGDPYEENQAVVPGRGIFQIDSVGAISMFVLHLRTTFGRKIELAAAANQHEENFFERMRMKIAAGTDFFMSQPVFTKKQVNELFEKYLAVASGYPLLVGIWPLLHRRTVEIIHGGAVTGVVLPDDAYEEALQVDSSDENGNRLWEWGMERAQELIGYVASSKGAQGVYIVAPLRNPLSVLPLVSSLKRTDTKN
jgi:5,10-methylenetetrahydrofolate reductase